ncbi:MAG: KEOPS complex subunit Cgi121 [Candidatus Micrarchaeota archaeon]
MRYLRVRSLLDPGELRKRLDKLDAVAIRPSLAESAEELELAAHLAVGSFERKTNVARQLRYEFLLWLSAKTDIKSAMEASAPKGEEFLLCIFSDTKPETACRMLDATKLPLGLKEKGEPLALERISLSRLKK